MESIVYNQKGKETGKIALPESVFGVKGNADLVHQVMQSLTSSQRQGSAHTKNRGEVRGGGKKPWRQKGTGRARHGSISSPLWVGGGVAHGPRSDKNYERKVNRKMKQRALSAVLSAKLRDGEILFVGALAFLAPKTVEAKGFLKNMSTVNGFERLSYKGKNTVFIITSTPHAALFKSFR